MADRSRHRMNSVLQKLEEIGKMIARHSHAIAGFLISDRMETV